MVQSQFARRVVMACGACAKAITSATWLCSVLATTEAAIAASIHMPHLPALIRARISLNELPKELGAP